MRSLSGLFFGLAIMLLCGGVVTSGGAWFGHAKDVEAAGAAMTAQDVADGIERVVSTGRMFALLANLLALVGLIFWIREARAAKRPDASGVFE